MPRSRTTLAALVASLALLPACGIGYNRTLFVTKTNFGFEASTVPPTIELDLSRTEGVVAPQFRDGQKLPVMASFRFNTNGVFSPAIGSAFATGDAAKTMAALYGDATPHDGEADAWETRTTDVSGDSFKGDSTVSLTRPPLVDGEVADFQGDDVRPVFFGTDTSLGVKIAWSSMASTVPDTAKIGYNRKELALVPIAMTTRQTANGSNEYDLRMASLLATVDTAFNANAGPGQAASTYLQYFATGEAATLLALQRDVRASMLARMDPNSDNLRRGVGSDFEGETATRFYLIATEIYEFFGKLEDDPKAAALRDDLDAFAQSTATTLTFPRSFEVDAGPAQTVDQDSDTPFADFPGLTSYMEALKEHVKKAADVTGFTYLPTNNPITQSEIDQLDANVAAVNQERVLLKESLANSEELQAAFDYFQAVIKGE